MNLTKDCAFQENCNVVLDATPTKTVYVNPFRIAFRMDGQRLTFGGSGSYTGLTVTYGTPPAPDPGDDGGGGDGGVGDGGDQSYGGSGSAGSTSSFPYITLQVLDEADGSWARALEAGLVAWETTVPVNTWQRLPNSADVVGAGEDEGKVFLGVATTPDFPVDIAQRQVDNGWGAYDMHDDQGNLESVFIPAGGSMFVWTQPRLYAVWGAPPS